jgi:hypothetical protein
MKQYIGDGVYIDIIDWGCLVLTTENGIEETNRIVLEPEVYNAFIQYFRKHLPAQFIHALGERSDRPSLSSLDSK